MTKLEWAKQYLKDNENEVREVHETLSKAGINTKEAIESFKKNISILGAENVTRS